MLCDYIINGNNRFAKKCIHVLVGKSLLKRSRFHATAPVEYDECQELIPGWQGFTVPNILPLIGPPVEKNPNDVFTIAYLSRIDPKKGLEFAFEAISRLDAQLTLKIYGSGEEEYLAQLRQLVSRLKIEDKIQWMEWQTPATKFQQLMKADVCILTSYNENFGNVIVEALYMGTPVLITDMVGLSSFVKANDLGWVIPLDIDVISNTILQAMSDDEKRARINKTGRQLVEANFAQDIVLNQYLDQYRLLLTNN
jgi:glycosyltransferase involved in cell wall biosynthesis